MAPDSRASDTRKRDRRAESDASQTTSSPDGASAESRPNASGTDSEPGVVIALLALVQPTFLGPAVAMAVAGGVLAPGVDPAVLGLYAVAVGLAVYVAHLRDAFVDRFVRGEESSGGTTPTALRVALAVVTVAFLAVVLRLWTLVGPIAAAATVPLWLLAIAHAPYLDTGPVGVTVDYAIGVAIAILGGYVLQTAAFPPRFAPAAAFSPGSVPAGIPPSEVVATAAIYCLVLSAVKISVDGLDREFDRSIGKRTIHVVVGSARADRLAAGLLVLASAVPMAIAAGGVVSTAPASIVVLSSAIPLGVAAIAVFVRPRSRSVRLQIASVYPFSVLFLGGICLGTTSACGRAMMTVLSAAI